MRARTWYRNHTFAHSSFPVERLVRARRGTVSVCLPARDEAETIGPILRELLPLRDRLGLVDQVVVVDRSSDGTGEIARRLGAEVYCQEDLLPSLGPVLGQGRRHVARPERARR